MSQDTNVIKGNIGRIYILKGGEIKDPMRMADFHPLSNVSGLLVHIEDGGGLTSLGKINFAPQLRGDNNVAYHWFPMYFRGFVEATVSSESGPRTFAQYFVYVPSQVLAMNENKKTPMDVALTVTQQSGVNYLGQFTDLTDLNANHPPTEQLSDDLMLAYVWDDGDGNGKFYQVEWDTLSSQYLWASISDATAYVRLKQKQYNLSYMTVQGGYAPLVERKALKDPQFEALMLEMQDINSRLYQYGVDFGNLETRVETLEFKTETLEGKVQFIEEDDIPRIDGELLRLENDKVDKIQDHRLINPTEINKVSKIIIDGNGLNALFNDGTYKQVATSQQFLDIVNELIRLETDKVDKTTTVNEKPLSGNVVLDSDDIPHDSGDVGNELRYLDNNKADKATTFTKTETTSEIATKVLNHNNDQTAHPYLLALIDAIQGAFVYRGNIDETTETIRNDKTLLDARIDDVYDRASRLGDVLKDNKGVEWYFNGDEWFEYGQGEIGEVSAENDGLMTVELFLKLMALYDKQTLDNLLDSKLNEGLTINGVSYDPIYNRYVLDAVKIIFNNPSKPEIDNKNVEEVILDILNEIDNIEESNEYLKVIDVRNGGEYQFRIIIDADGDLAYDLEEEI